MIDRFVKIRNEPLHWLVDSFFHTPEPDVQLLLVCFCNGRQRIFRADDVIDVMMESGRRIGELS